MAHKARFAQHTPDRALITRCQPCGKYRYPNRRTAQAAAKQTPGTHMATYRCPVFAGWWHLGHMPRSVVHGKEPKAAFQARVERRRREAS
jgi:hypothetical protein